MFQWLSKLILVLTSLDKIIYGSNKNYIVQRPDVPMTIRVNLFLMGPDIIILLVIKNKLSRDGMLR